LHTLGSGLDAGLAFCAPDWNTWRRFTLQS